VRENLRESEYNESSDREKGNRDEGYLSTSPPHDHDDNLTIDVENVSEEPINYW